MNRLTDIFLREDHKALEELAQTTVTTMNVLEEARASAGIRYPWE